MSTHSPYPQHIDEETWYYEDTKGLIVLRDVHGDDGKRRRTDQFTIPWKMIMTSVERHMTPRRQRHAHNK